jgi:hypothetical protein
MAHPPHQPACRAQTEVLAAGRTAYIPFLVTVASAVVCIPLDARGFRFAPARD